MRSLIIIVFRSQDFKPANLMLCLNGLVKITGFGLAAFSRKQDNDPWRPDRRVGIEKQLCAQLEEFTITYTS